MIASLRETDSHGEAVSLAGMLLIVSLQWLKGFFLVNFKVSIVKHFVVICYISLLFIFFFAFERSWSGLFLFTYVHSSTTCRVSAGRRQSCATYCRLYLLSKFLSFFFTVHLRKLAPFILPSVYLEWHIFKPPHPHSIFF